MREPTAPDRGPDSIVHDFKNHLSVIVGFCDVLLRELAADDLRRADVEEIQRAALAAVALLPAIAARQGQADV